MQDLPITTSTILSTGIQKLLDGCLAPTALHAYIFDRLGHVVYVSEAVSAALQSGRTELVGKTGNELGIPQDLENARLQAMAQEGNIQLQCEGRSFRCFCIRDDVEEVTFVACIEDKVLDVEQALNEGERLWAHALAGNGDGTWDWNIETGQRFYSSGYRQMIGLSGDEDADFDELLHPDDRSVFMDGMVRLFKGEVEVYSQEHRLLSKDGSYKWVRSRNKVVSRDEEGRPLRVIGLIHDNTEKHAADAALRMASLVYEFGNEAVVMTDHENRIISVNNAFTKITGYSGADVIGHNPSMLSSGRHAPEFYQSMWSSLQKTGIWTGEIWNRRKNGDIYPEWLTIRQVTDKIDSEARYIAIFSDIGERKATEERIRQLSYQDDLTGLPNRLMFDEQVEHAIAAAKRHQGIFSVLALNINSFGEINDSLGREAGDAVLKLVGERLAESVKRSQDTIARSRGDEFLILLPDLNGEESSMLAQSVADSFSHPFDVDGHEVVLTPSIGIALFPLDAQDADTLVGCAETAMFYTREAGKGGYRLFAEDLKAGTLQRMTLENSLRQAMEQNEFLIHYQPLVDLNTGNVVGAEALLRWRHPEMDMVSPNVFIELAEESGVIVPLGEWMINKVCVQIRDWQQEGLRVVPISVNISARQFRQKNLPELIEKLLKENDVDPFFLEIECNEDTVMDDVRESAVIIQRIKKRGIRVSVDNFGIGYSSLPHLKRLHIDKLKIDQSLVQPVVDDLDDSAVVRAIVGMGHSLRMEVVAEGIETQKQLDYLKALHCDQVQGHLFSEALPADAFGALIREGRTLAV